VQQLLCLLLPLGLEFGLGHFLGDFLAVGILAEILAVKLAVPDGIGNGEGPLAASRGSPNSMSTAFTLTMAGSYNATALQARVQFPPL